ncbi:hypothetical protein GCM10009624_26930 [Gordonia sinesedis]
MLSALLTVVAMAAIVIAVPSLWVKERLVDTEGFISMVGPLADDQRVKDYLADQITAEVTSRVAIPGAEGVVAPIARGYTDSPQFRADFADVVGQQHAWLFDDPASNPGDTLQLDITDMVNRVIATTPVQATVPGPVTVPLSEGATGLDAGRYHGVGQQITLIAYVSVIVAVAASVLALLVARRRGTVLAWLGIGGLLAAAAAWATSIYIASLAGDEIANAQDGGKTVAQLAIDTAEQQLQQVAGITAIAGAVVLVAGIVLRLIAGVGAARR